MSALSGPALLFCPADRPERYAKALATADMAILDLEDAVPADRKDVAREALVANPGDPARTIVRINPTTTADHAADLAALARTDYRLVMLAKAESRAQVESLDRWQVIALCETARAITRAAEIAVASNLVALMYGAEDLMVSMGGHSSRLESGPFRDVARHARSAVLLHAASQGVAAIDAVYLDTVDDEGLLAEAGDAAASGFAAKACIHPRQVAVVRRAYRPSDRQIAWARRVLQAREQSSAAVFTVDGQMIDAPLFRQAEAIAAAASA